ncbi:gibberellin-regulated protein 14 [Daucus carota subsp. sativus]|uniref:Gibberellin-regulated protein 14 n=1 Tax=Daucus carota subsp. sativus TaxID=79200 RepID=A0A162AKI8_DAUCS|nr:PREDICTED: gibberellin-regulated protein 14 [Daucus carota subsp. sativus]
MALRSFFHLLASLLLVSTMVLSESEQLLESGIITKVPPHAQSPLKSPIAPAPAPTPVAAPVKAPPPVAPTPVKIPPPPVQSKAPPPPQPPVPVKVPPPPRPSVKPPSPPISPPPPSPPRNTKECYPPCLVRCKLHSRKNVCLRACVTCCDRCKCVPPGQFGNKEKCGKCYANMTTHGGKSKCP